MKQITDEEIKAFFNKDLFDDYRDPDEVKINREEKKITVNVHREYEFVPCDFKILNKIGEFFETDKVNGSEGDYYNGCETCDYGSNYEVNFIIEE